MAGVQRLLHNCTESWECPTFREGSVEECEYSSKPKQTLYSLFSLL